MKILSCKEFQFDNFIIPSFTLNQGEIINLQLFSGSHFFRLEDKLAKVFTGVENHESVKLTGKLGFAEHIQESRIRSFFSPMTVGKYLQKNANQPDNEFPDFQGDKLELNTPISRLPGNSRKFLSIYSLISKYDGVIFDLVGNDPTGAEQIFNFVEQFVNSRNGCAILLNNFDDFTDRSSQNLKISTLS